MLACLRRGSSRTYFSQGPSPAGQERELPISNAEIFDIKGLRRSKESPAVSSQNGECVNAANTCLPRDNAPPGNGEFVGRGSILTVSEERYCYLGRNGGFHM
ncbi:Hypothetical predicted protein [Podarcis lilfordi]|uniref:Uncharacterized protein n=1 Tax=Podarcis lilfordi TaxID=74358 RepID=A0AA35PCT2_9SAUR|nr:Hypothetical predicted protein [Podarcis lilfordi]